MSRSTQVVFWLLVGCSMTSAAQIESHSTDASESRAVMLSQSAAIDRAAVMAALRAGKAVDLRHRPGSILGPVRLQMHEEEGESRLAAQPFTGQRQTTPAAVMRRAGFASVQVNVAPGGLNIVGDAANEPSLAIDPTNPNRMAIGWRQFDSVMSGARKAGYAYSTNGGQSWTFGGALQGGTDPVLDADADGNFYYASYAGPVSVFKSMDGGVTWPLKVFAYGGDKEWLVVDRTIGPGAGHIYQYWTTAASYCPPNTTCPDWNFTRSINRGASYESPILIPPPLLQKGTMTVAPNGVLHSVGAVWQDLQSLGHAVSRSHNAQLAGEPPIFTSGQGIDLGGYMAFGGVNPGGLIGQVWIDSDHSFGPTRGYLYVLSSVFDFDDIGQDVFIVRSIDGGRTWSPPRRINDDAPIGAWHWFGALSVAPNGRIDVTWYDTRNDPVDPSDPSFSEVFYSYSLDAGETWSANVAVSPMFGHFLGYPQSQQKIGDYTHMRSDLGGASLAYAATFNGEQDVYFVRIPFDCNNNGIEDPDDIAHGAPDCNFNAIPDSCESHADCNQNLVRDICEIGSLASEDCNGNWKPDGCEPNDDCTGNGRADICDLANGTSSDCNLNTRPDECDVALGSSSDVNSDSIPDECHGACKMGDACFDTTEPDCRVRLGAFYAYGIVCPPCPPFLSNDTCADAVVIPGDLDSALSLINRCAGTDGDRLVECDNGVLSIGADVWYAYLAPCNGLLEVDLCSQADFDSVLTIYAGGHSCDCGGATGDSLACDDDGCGSAGGPSRASTPALLRECYIIRVAGLVGDQGDALLSITFSPNSGLPGDCDSDSSLDLGDLLQFTDCLLGPQIEISVCCECADMTRSGVVTLEEVAAFQNQFVGHP